MIEAIDNKNDFVEFRKLFEVVNKKGWVKSLRKGYTGVGYTFECLLNKEEENFPIPDYNSIEIKTTRKSSRHQLHLFTATPDGDFLFPIKRIIEKLEYPDKNDNQHKIFNLGFSGKKFSPIGYYKVGKILVNRNGKRVGQTHDRGMAFTIEEDSIGKLFDEVSI